MDENENELQVQQVKENSTNGQKYITLPPAHRAEGDEFALVYALGNDYDKVPAHIQAYSRMDIMLDELLNVEGLFQAAVKGRTTQENPDDHIADLQKAGEIISHAMEFLDEEIGVHADPENEPDEFCPHCDKPIG